MGGEQCHVVLDRQTWYPDFTAVASLFRRVTKCKSKMTTKFCRSICIVQNSLFTVLPWEQGKFIVSHFIYQTCKIFWPQLCFVSPTLPPGTDRGVQALTMRPPWMSHFCTYCWVAFCTPSIWDRDNCIKGVNVPSHRRSRRSVDLPHFSNNLGRYSSRKSRADLPPRRSSSLHIAHIHRKQYNVAVKYLPPSRKNFPDRLESDIKSETNIICEVVKWVNSIVSWSICCFRNR